MSGMDRPRSRASDDSAHIRLICWEQQHVQVVSPEQLRQLRIAPICTWKSGPSDICGSPIWAVEHEGEPTRYVGKPPHWNWQSWADCIPKGGAEKPTMTKGTTDED